MAKKSIDQKSGNRSIMTGSVETTSGSIVRLRKARMLRSRDFSYIVSPKRLGDVEVKSFFADRPALAAKQ